MPRSYLDSILHLNSSKRQMSDKILSFNHTPDTFVSRNSLCSLNRYAETRALWTRCISVAISVLTLVLSSGENIAHRQVNQPKIKERS